MTSPLSGEPILQNGKIVGVVTHVHVNDPAREYGIFIENMLDEAVKKIYDRVKKLWHFSSFCVIINEKERKLLLTITEIKN